jgi:allantoin racemase
MRICYLGPPGRQERLQAFAAPGTEIVARTEPNGPASIESVYEEFLSAAILMETVVELEREGFDAIIPGCFGDPGIDGARELVRIPVVGPGLAGMMTACNLGHRYGIIAPLEGDVRPTETLALHHGLERKLAGVRPLGVAVLGMNDDQTLTLQRLVAVSRELMERDRADVIVLGCGTLSFRALEVQEALGIPVVNPLRAAIKLCELLVSSGLGHSKRSYPVPPKLAAASQLV